MKRRPTNYFTRMLFIMSFVVWMLGGGMAFSQTPGGNTPDSPSAVQEAPPATEDQDEVIERGIRRDHLGLPRRLPTKPTVPRAPAPKVFVPSLGGPSSGGTLSQGDRYTAPTPSLTMVANALKLRNKSLTTLISLPPNLPVTQPVEISIGYFSPAGPYAPGTQRITQTYVRGTGNHFRNNDPEGDGKPRQMRADITLRELQPGGQSFAVIWRINLDPLYDVTISPLKFNLENHCDRVGKSEIRFNWYSPDRSPHQARFSTNPPNIDTISAFAWSRAEVSTQTNLQIPIMGFWEDDPLVQFVPPLVTKSENIVPGRTGTIRGDLNSIDPNQDKSCTANFEYQITYTLRGYPNL